MLQNLRISDKTSINKKNSTTIKQGAFVKFDDFQACVFDKISDRFSLGKIPEIADDKKFVTRNSAGSAKKTMIESWEDNSAGINKQSFDALFCKLLINPLVGGYHFFVA